MIAFLEGKVELKTAKFAVLNVNGIGYKVFVSDSILRKLKQESEARFFVYSHLRENLSELYGFETFDALELFELLLSVNGVGPKAALSIMMLSSAETLKQAIASGEKTLLTKVSGIGQRTAERIILELKNKVSASPGSVKKLESDSEAADALISLGYTRSQAGKALKQISVKTECVEDRVREALKVLSKSR